MKRKCYGERGDVEKEVFMPRQISKHTNKRKEINYLSFFVKKIIKFPFMRNKLEQK